MHRRVYFYRNGQEIDTRSNGMALAGWGIHSGHVSGTLCFEQVRVGDEYGRTFDLDERDFGGPVAVKVWTPGKKPEWFGVASVKSVEEAAERVR